jgi:predicted Zn-dependent protease
MTSGIQDLDAQAQAQYARAAEALVAGKPREAAALAKALLERVPEQPDVLHLIAGIRGRLGDHAGAVWAPACAGAMVKEGDQSSPGPVSRSTLSFGKAHQHRVGLHEITSGGG